MEEGKEDGNEIRDINFLMGGQRAMALYILLVPITKSKRNILSSFKKCFSSSDKKVIILVVLVSVLLVLVYQISAYLRGERYGPLLEGYSRYAPRE